MPLYTTLHCIGPEAPKAGEQGMFFWMFTMVVSTNDSLF